ncbi:MAG: PilZ domain-containing protein [Lachnospiraceae bacterium]|nr:PilZ domain-containing protein [Lachnospiraceae bacterium]
MSDKRFYDRTKTTIEALLYECHENKEIPGYVDNISERGICFKVPLPNPDCADLQTGDPLSFQFADEIPTGSGSDPVIMSHKCIIRHLNQDVNTLSIGCYITEPEFEKYAIRKKIAPLLNKT